MPHTDGETSSSLADLVLHPITEESGGGEGRPRDEANTKEATSRKQVLKAKGSVGPAVGRSLAEQHREQRQAAGSRSEDGEKGTDCTSELAAKECKETSRCPQGTMGGTVAIYREVEEGKWQPQVARGRKQAGATSDSLRGGDKGRWGERKQSCGGNRKKEGCGERASALNLELLLTTTVTSKPALYSDLGESHEDIGGTEHQSSAGVGPSDCGHHALAT